MDRLKPCPFCGSKDIKLCGNHRDSFWFRCNKCASIDSYDTERQAVRAWNKRVAIPSVYKGMTNGEVIKMLYPQGEIVKGLYGISGNPLICVNLNISTECSEMVFTEDWWNSLYEPQEISDHNLKMWKEIYAEEKRREGSE